MYILVIWVWWGLPLYTLLKYMCNGLWIIEHKPGNKNKTRKQGKKVIKIAFHLAYHGKNKKNALQISNISLVLHPKSLVCATGLVEYSCHWNTGGLLMQVLTHWKNYSLYLLSLLQIDYCKHTNFGGHWGWDVNDYQFHNAIILNQWLPQFSSSPSLLLHYQIPLYSLT